MFYAKIHTDMPWSTSDRIVQNATQHVFSSPSPIVQNATQHGFSSPLGTSLNIIEKVEGLLLVDRSFAPRDSPRLVICFSAKSPSPTGHGGHYDIKYSLFD